MFIGKMLEEKKFELLKLFFIYKCGKITQESGSSETILVDLRFIFCDAVVIYFVLKFIVRGSVCKAGIKSCQRQASRLPAKTI